MATRLLDWTKNPLIALFFAISKSPDSDGEVYLLNGYCAYRVQELNPFEITFTGFFYPNGIVNRVINQRGLFSISHIPTEPIDEHLLSISGGIKLLRIRIPKEVKLKMLSSLDLLGINEFNIYGDLDSLSTYLNRWNNDGIRTEMPFG